MLKEIGSNFWLSPNEIEASGHLDSPASVFGYDGSDFAWLSSGRSAIALVIKEIERRQPDISRNVVVPAFTCNSVYEPFLKAGYNVSTYPVKKDLMCCGEEIVNAVFRSNAGIVLIHRLFGFDTITDLPECMKRLRQHGIIVIEDCTQSLYSTLSGSDADYYVASIRKWCGVPDGAFAVCRQEKFGHKPSLPDLVLQRKKCCASLLKNEYMNDKSEEKAAFLELYSEAEDLLAHQTGLFSISPVSESVQANLDVCRLKDTRRRNYGILLQKISGIIGVAPVFNTLSRDVVPLYFPLWCDNRKRLQTLLRDYDIYAPVVWPKADNAPAVNMDANDLYNHLLCIPIDQRYGDDDMNWIAEVILNQN